MVWKRLTAFLAIALLTVAATCGTVNAQSYSDEYPQIGNSGSPLWIHCQIRNMGDFVIVLDPNTNPQSFGFDTLGEGYNLINNTGESIYGKAYSTSSPNTAYLVKFPSYYRITMRTGYDKDGNQTVYEDHKILDIYGTTLDLIDYTGNRGNDKLSREESEVGYEVAQTIILAVIGLCMLMRPLFAWTYRLRGISRG